jgi:adenylate cyclase
MQQNRSAPLQIFSELRKRKVVTSALFYVPFAWIATEVLTFLFDKFPVPDWADDLVAAAFVAGFPAFMVLAWTFDVGPDGVTRTSASRFHGFTAIVFAMLIMGAGTTLLFQQIESGQVGSGSAASPAQAGSIAPHNPSVSKSVAVYPFENLSSDPENAYFSVGMTSELVTRLAQVKGLQIAALTRSKQEVLSLGIEPSVSYRLEGSVRKSGNTVRIAALLTDLSSGFTLWSDEFDGQLEDVFALQEQTALRIIEALDIQLSPKDSVKQSGRNTDSGQAYDAFLRGWSLVESFHVSFARAEEKLETARGHFQEALAIDPGFTRAIAGLSMVESYAVFLDIEPAAHLQLARKLAQDALSLDDTIYESHFAMAKALAGSEDTSAAIAEYRKVVELEPQNGYAWCEMSSVLNAEDPIGAENAAREAIRFRPAYSLAYYTLGAALQKQDRLGEAVDAFRQSLQLDPNNVGLEGVIQRLSGELIQAKTE